MACIATGRDNFFGIVGGGLVVIHSSGKTVFRFPDIESITLGEEVDDFAGGANVICG